MRALNIAIEEAALSQSFIDKVTDTTATPPNRQTIEPTTWIPGGDYRPGENREQRRRRQQAELREAKRARKAATA